MSRRRVFVPQLIGALTATALFVTPVEARYCWNPNCAMCNRLFGPIGGVSMEVLPGSAAASSTSSLTVGPVINSTPHDVVERMLDQLDLQPDDVLYDLGCGDGRFLIAAVKRFRCRAVGIEINPRVVEVARARVKRAGCGRICIVQGDARRFLYDEADAIVMYLFPPLMAQLVWKIDCPIVSYNHRIPGRDCRRVSLGERGAIYVSGIRPGNFRMQ
jgi:SAM-dependent methyltransferase